MKKKLTLLTILVCTLFIFPFTAPVAESASLEDDPLLGVREGWAWPVVVIPPPEGWDSPQGESIKYAMRLAERRISLQREGIRGREVTFMFANLSSVNEVAERLNVWSGMKVAVVVSFGTDEINNFLARYSQARGPAVVFAGGENLSIISPGGQPHKYLFALDFPYYARANALAEMAVIGSNAKNVAVITDFMSKRLAKGADLTTAFLKKRGFEVTSIYVPAMRHDQYGPQVTEAENSGADVIVSWLDSMATLSIWRTCSLNGNGTKTFFSGNQARLMLDAQGLALADKDVLLERNELGKRAIIKSINDQFHKTVEEPVIAARANVLANWVIQAYEKASQVDPSELATALSRVENIALMDEILSIDPRTHRPKSRRYGILRINNRFFESAGSVEVHSIEVVE